MSQNPSSAERSANIFINYRREDSAGHAGWLFDRLSARFPGRVFMDVDTLEPGVDFVEAIEQAVGSCQVLIVLIGHEWVGLQDASGRRRLDDPADFVRLEVSTALARKIRVIPILVQGAAMPGQEELPPDLVQLTRRNAIELSDARWAYDVERLTHAIEEVLKGLDAAPAPLPIPPPAPGRSQSPKVWATALLVVLALSGLGVAPAAAPGTPSRLNLGLKKLVASFPLAADTCKQGWREARPTDHVCVTSEVRTQTALDNRLAASRRNPGPYGPTTCLTGYVWREAFENDTVCVTEATWEQARRDNVEAGQRRASPR